MLQIDKQMENIKKYFTSWLNQHNECWSQIFSPNIYYSECYGPEYLGLNQLNQWFAQWNEQGKVVKWEIKQIYPSNQTLIVEWYFACYFNEKYDEFNGVSLITFDDENLICSIKEFKSEAKHYQPFRN
ncbi:hypothetical protein [Enterococcus columbae]|uniref:SnoaL-like domain-containing protein n=1 Tax=Enterococcus columbae DSM 7374 = ATCC 51263 TaxID=1121865 RepID=S0KJD9_9ENTE|nr:hypothetical protein [Enterococcus columbae]EOT44909.1 hypothetical protein OMW_00095 [Enterococcus columbae DSM 7374 = ATCC 51263]EOW84202.1 hypothetical protein I568_00689 [Enterococcus columbae DSM 7374 = ATCC 51263]